MSVCFLFFTSRNRNEDLPTAKQLPQQQINFGPTRKKEGLGCLLGATEASKTQ
jgi:hypothetical protein